MIASGWSLIEAWVPLFLFSVLFGLSMDYHVLLLSRIRERHDHSGDTSDAVTFGVASTARIITGAALIIVAVFAGFARGDLIMFQQMGFGVAVALVLDATVVRDKQERLPAAPGLAKEPEHVAGRCRVSGAQVWRETSAKRHLIAMMLNQKRAQYKEAYRSEFAAVHRYIRRRIGRDAADDVSAAMSPRSSCSAPSASSPASSWSSSTCSCGDASPTSSSCRASSTSAHSSHLRHLEPCC